VNSKNKGEKKSGKKRKEKEVCWAGFTCARPKPHPTSLPRGPGLFTARAADFQAGPRRLSHWRARSASSLTCGPLMSAPPPTEVPGMAACSTRTSPLGRQPHRAHIGSPDPRDSHLPRLCLTPVTPSHLCSPAPSPIPLPGAACADEFHRRGGKFPSRHR
jgi:hypothetical protein